jgi:hypothetical protein
MEETGAGDMGAGVTGKEFWTVFAFSLFQNFLLQIQRYLCYILLYSRRNL